MSDIIFNEPITIYRGGYHPSFCQKLLNHMAKGMSFSSFAGSIGVSPSTIRTWADSYPDFKEAKEIAESLNMGAWESIAIDQATGETKGNSATTTFMMKNLHAEEYRDKQFIESEGNVVFQISTGVPSSLEELEANLPIEAEAKIIGEDVDLL